MTPHPPLGIRSDIPAQQVTCEISPLICSCAHYVYTTPIAYWTKPDDGLYWLKHVVFCQSNTYHILDIFGCVTDCKIPYLLVLCFSFCEECGLLT
jgi:hypothetical protein